MEQKAKDECGKRNEETAKNADFSQRRDRKGAFIRKRWDTATSQQEHSLTVVPLMGENVAPHERPRGLKAHGPEDVGWALPTKKSRRDE